MFGSHRFLISSRFTDKQSKNILQRNNILSTWHQLHLRHSARLRPEILAEVESRLYPLNTEVETEGDGVVFVIDSENI